MNKVFLKQRDRTIAEQIASMKGRYPKFDTSFTVHRGLKVTGTLKPTSRSKDYHFVLKYNLSCSPKMQIVSPKLQKNSKGENIPHLYSCENLCLYKPKYYEFKRTDFLCDTIIPWTSLWLYYYEVWLLTDEWLGGGEHPE